MLSRRAILPLITAVVFVGSCNSSFTLENLFNPQSTVSPTPVDIDNIRIPVTSPKPLLSGSDANFQKLFGSHDKKAVLVTFKKESAPNAETGVLKTFDYNFLQSFLKKYLDAKVIIVDVDKCPETVTHYRVPKVSEKVHFNISLRIKTKDELKDQKLLEMIQELLDYTDHIHTTTLVKEQVESIIESVLNAELHGGKLDENLPRNVQEIVKSLVPQIHQHKGEIKVKNDASKQSNTNVREVQISETETEKVFLGPVSATGGQDETTENAIQRVVAVNDEEVESALSNATNELTVMFFTDNSLKSDDIEVKKFLRQLSITKSNVKIIQVNVDTEKCGKTKTNYKVTKIPSVLFLKYGTQQDVEITSYNKKALMAEIINLFANTVVVKSDEELDDALSNAANELIVMNFTDNSLNDNDCDTKMFLSDITSEVSYMKVLQVNTNTGKCQESMNKYNIDSQPSVVFIKFGEIQAARVTNYDDAALEAEIINLQSKSKVVNSDQELTEALWNQENELIVLLVTDNSLNSDDRNMKSFLSGVSFSAPHIKIIQVNVNNNRCDDTIQKYAIDSYPLLVFLKQGKRQACVTSFVQKAITTELLNLVSTTEIVNSDNELEDALSNAENELIVLNVTDNSETGVDCRLKEFLGMFSKVDSNVKIIQVNANGGTCKTTLDLNHITVFPTVLFLKRGKMQKAQVTGFNTTAIKAEISTLISNSVIANSDEEINSLSYAESELNIMFFTDNSLDRGDCQMKIILNNISIHDQRIKLIQVNTNTRKCSGAMTIYNIVSVPELLFFKRDKLQNTRVTGFDYNAIDAEISILLSRSIIADTDDEVLHALENQKNEFIIMFFTNNSLDECDCDMKKLLSGLLFRMENLNIIRVNTNTGKCLNSVSQYNIDSFPSLVFIKNGDVQPTQVTGCEGNQMKTEISNFLSQSLVVNSDEELINVLSNAANELNIINITDNSFDYDDFNVKIYLSAPSIRKAGIRIVQVNANSRKCSRTIGMYRVLSYPLLLFVKNGMTPADRVIGFNSRAIQVEINNLLLPSVVVGSDVGLDRELQNAKTELVVVFITDNSVNGSDCDMKEYLYSLSTLQANVKIIQVNTNAVNCKKVIGDNNITSFPSVLFWKHGEMQKVRVSGFNHKAMDAEISNLFVNKVQVNNDVELIDALSNASNELIIINITDNSLSDNDCNIKLYLSTLLTRGSYIKVIQMNTNTNGCQKFIDDYNIVFKPTVLFIKHGKMQMARVTSYYHEVLEAEKMNLLSNSIVVNSDEELDTALSNKNSELIVMFITDNSLDENDCYVKKLLSNVSKSAPSIKIIQVNANTGFCKQTIQYNNIQFYPTLLFYIHGVKQTGMVSGFDKATINTAIGELVESSLSNNRTLDKM